MFASFYHSPSKASTAMHIVYHAAVVDKDLWLKDKDKDLMSKD